MHRLLLIVFAIASGWLTALPAAAQGYPVKPVRVFVVIAAGAGSDLTIRMVADKMSPELKRNMVIENRPGASGAIAADIVAKAAPDGYTLLVGTSSTMIMLPAVNPKLPYDPVRDFAAVGQMTQGNVLIVVRSSLPVAQDAQGEHGVMQ